VSKRKAGKGQREQARAQAIEAVSIVLCALPRLPQDEIDRHPYNEKRRFVMRWFDLQHIPFVVSA
jgi:hypothetical protein